MMGFAEVKQQQKTGSTSARDADHGGRTRVLKGRSVMEATVNEMLEQSYKFYRDLSRSAKIPAMDQRHLLLSSFRSLALEHFGSILNLCQAGLTGSALALYRPLRETIIRGEWLCFCAETSYCEAFMLGTYDRGRLSLRVMAREVDKVLDLGPRLVDSELFFHSMSDFTHAGHAVIVPRLGVEAGSHSPYPDAMLLELLRQATALTAQHVSVALRATQQNKAADDIVQSLAAMQRGSATSV